MVVRHAADTELRRTAVEAVRVQHVERLVETEVPRQHSAVESAAPEIAMQEEERLAIALWLHGQERGAHCGRLLLDQRRCQASRRRASVQSGERQPPAQSTVNLVKEPHSEEGMTAELEEVVGDPDLRQV